MGGRPPIKRVPGSGNFLKGELATGSGILWGGGGRSPPIKMLGGRIRDLRGIRDPGYTTLELNPPKKPMC